MSGHRLKSNDATSYVRRIEMPGHRGLGMQSFVLDCEFGAVMATLLSICDQISLRLSTTTNGTICDENVIKWVQSEWEYESLSSSECAVRPMFSTLTLSSCARWRFPFLPSFSLY